jgi:hypothetical protein
MDVAKSILVSLWTAQKHQMKTMFILHILAFLHLGCVSVNPHRWRNRQSRVCISLSKSINPRYSRVTIAPGISDRDLVQERFLTRLPDQSLGPNGALNDVFSTAACHGNLWVVMMDPGCRGELEDVSMSAISALFGISWKHMTQRHSWTPGACVPMAGNCPRYYLDLPFCRSRCCYSQLWNHPSPVFRAMLRMLMFFIYLDLMISST